MTNETLLLLIAFQFKHLIADYYLQFPYMYENKGKPEGWLTPLLHHATVHMVFTFIIVLVYHGIVEQREPEMFFVMLQIVLFDGVTHFVTDRWKATQGVGPDTKKFWTDLGIDQMIHHTVGILIVLFLVSS